MISCIIRSPASLLRQRFFLSSRFPVSQPSSSSSSSSSSLSSSSSSSSLSSSSSSFSLPSTPSQVPKSQTMESKTNKQNRTERPQRWSRRNKERAFIMKDCRNAKCRCHFGEKRDCLVLLFLCILFTFNVKEALTFCQWHCNVCCTHQLPLEHVS